ncbi:CesT family type III secretion system chaperone [Rhabdochlamydiaceae symbiont of Dictyostelium giganteum]|uniref:CesT family type III secretion system chaperone n=1 Tax=Rhabdochlamydiaceae symbiont of Dictyostelium giganteum TaxID=3342349 RepID=UPI00384B30CF
MDLFSKIITDLSLLIDYPIIPDPKQLYGLEINHTLHLQLKEENNKVCISTFLGELTPGVGRDQLLKWALRENQLRSETGVLCYTPRNNQLAFFLVVELETLSGVLLADILEAFLQKALLWKKAIDTNENPLETSFTSKEAPSIFDLHP